MSAVHDAILKARRRSLIDRSLRLGGRGALVGAMLGIGLLLTDRLTGLAAPLWVYAAIVAVPAVIGVLRAAVTLPGAFEFARRLDRSMHLKDRLATSHLLSEGALTAGRFPRTDDDFAALVQQDAERLAASLDCRAAAPIRVTGAWGGAAVLSASLVAGILYLPPLARAAAEAAPEQREREAQEAREREELLADVDRIMEDLRQEALIDDRAAGRLDALERLREQLLAEDRALQREPSALREETAAHVSELAERLAAQAERDALAAEELAERFARLEAPEGPMSAAEFEEALRRGDFGRAAESLEDLLRHRESFTPEERHEMAEHLRELGEQIERAGELSREELEERRAQIEQALRDHGIDEEALRELMEALHDDDLPREELDRRLHADMTDEELAQQLANELERLRERQRIEDRVEEDARSISESLREAADEMESTEESEPPDPRDAEADPAEQEADAAPDERTPQEQQQPGEERETEQQPQQGEGEQREGAAPDDQPEGEQPGEEQRQGERPGEEDEQREGAAPDPGAEETETQPAPGEPGDEEQIGEAAADAEEEETGETAERPRQRGDSLRDIDQRRQAAERRRQMSDRLREESRRLADPQHEGREQRPMPAPQPGASDGTDAGVDGPRTPVEGDPTPFRPDGIEDLDARTPDDGDPGEIIAEWFSEEARELDPGAARTGDPQQRARQAQRIAERAVDEQAVPARYHDAIRRYFGRLNQTIERAAEDSRQSRDN